MCWNLKAFLNEKVPSLNIVNFHSCDGSVTDEHDLSDMFDTDLAAWLAGKQDGTICTPAHVDTCVYGVTSRCCHLILSSDPLHRLGVGLDRRDVRLAVQVSRE